MCTYKFNSLDSCSTDSSIDNSIETLSSPLFPYYKPILTSDARARTIISGYHVSLNCIKILRLFVYIINQIFCRTNNIL